MHIIYAQTKLELELVRSSSVGMVESSEEPPAVGGAGELQAALELVAELRKQLQSMKDETAERERALQAEVEKLNKAEDSQERSTGQLSVTSSSSSQIHLSCYEELILPSFPLYQGHSLCQYPYYM